MHFSIYFSLLILFFSFLAWKRFVPLQQEERASERRRAQLRLKVAAWIPDYADAAAAAKQS